MRKIDAVQVITLLANVGVIAGIFFLAVQLRQTQSALSAQAYQSRALETIDRSWQMIGSDDEFLNLLAEFRRGQLDVEALPVAERIRLTRFYFVIRSDTDNEHYQYEHGFFDEDFYRNGTQLDIKANAPRWRLLGVGEPRESFRKEVDRILADPSIGVSE